MAINHPDSRWEVWKRELRSVCGVFQTDPGPALAQFRGSINPHRSLGLEYADVVTNARRIMRRERDVGGDDGKYFFLVYQMRGRSLMAQSDQAAFLEPGDMVLIDSCRPSEFRYRGISRQLSLHLPRTDLLAAAGKEGVVTARRIPGDLPVAQVVRNLLLQVHAQSTRLGASDTGGLREAIAALVAPLVRRDTVAAAPDFEHMAVNVHSVRQYIEANLMESTLSPTTIARALGCSPRHVHRAFAGDGITVAEFIRLRRLEQCARQLIDARHAADGITEIAFRWGFTDASHFSRAFKEHFGCSPRTWRQEQGAGGTCLKETLFLAGQ